MNLTSGGSHWREVWRGRGRSVGKDFWGSEWFGLVREAFLSAEFGTVARPGGWKKLLGFHMARLGSIRFLQALSSAECGVWSARLSETGFDVSEGDTVENFFWN